MQSNLLGRSLGFLALCVCVAAVAGCAGVFGGSDVSCDDLSSSEWKSLANDDRTDEAEAIKECGTLDGMTRSEVVSWMGEPTRLGNQDTWTTADGTSDVPTITVEYRNNKVDQIFVNGN
ncbi:MAG: hypothetical protein KDB66_10020 [Solirubrobacterales bacterium]|nr:hypothetical protein [Solirubrobacterales bacterium]